MPLALSKRNSSLQGNLLRRLAANITEISWPHSASSANLCISPIERIYTFVRIIAHHWWKKLNINLGFFFRPIFLLEATHILIFPARDLT